MLFNSHYDAPVRVACLLVNALTPGERRGKPYAAPSGEIRRGEATDALRSAGESFESLALVTDQEALDLERAAHVLRAVFTAVADDDLAAAAAHVNTLLESTGTRPVLVLHDGDPSWHLHQAGTIGGLAGEWAGACAAGLAVVLGSEARSRLGVCTAPRCDRVYVDTSYNGKRRFCSTACQNRVKTAAFRSRNRS